MTTRKHIKHFQAVNYQKADERVLGCLIRAMLAHCGLWANGERKLKRFNVFNDGL